MIAGQVHDKAKNIFKVARLVLLIGPFKCESKGWKMRHTACEKKIGVLHWCCVATWVASLRREEASEVTCADDAMWNIAK